VIVISSLWKIDEALSRFNVRHLISINDPGSRPPDLSVVRHANRRNFEFHDATRKTAGNRLVSRSQIEEILSFGRGVIDGGDPVLIHCTAGVSRSVAAGLILAASLNKVEISALMELLRDKAPYSQPNLLVVRLGDDCLGLNGRLVAAVSSLSEPNSMISPEPFVLNVV
jgi:predicted protein tyrosine phosphatase